MRAGISRDYLDFALGDLLEDPRAAAEIAACPPFGLFTLVRVPNRKAA